MNEEPIQVTEEAPPAEEQQQAGQAEGTGEGEPQAEQAEEKLYAGKYRTPEDLEKAYIEAQAVIGRQGQELGQYRQPEPWAAQQGAQGAQPGQGQGQDADPLTVILRLPASKLATTEGAWDGWVRQTYGYDPIEMTAEDWLEVKQDVKQYVQQQQYAAQQAAQQAVQQFQAQYPDLAPYGGQLQMVDAMLVQSGAYQRCQSEAEGYDLLARTARAMFGIAQPVNEAARTLGQLGGQAAAAAAQRRVAPPTPPAPVGGTTAGAATGRAPAPSPFESLSDWSR